MSKKFIYLEHPADIKIQSFGKNLSELFVNSALGMMDFLFGEINFTKTTIVRTDVINIEGEDLESLLVNWLAELLYLSAVHKCFYCKFQIENFSAESNNFQIIARVDAVAAKAKDDIKAVTYHEVTIQKTIHGFTAAVVYDI